MMKKQQWKESAEWKQSLADQNRRSSSRGKLFSIYILFIQSFISYVDARLDAVIQALMGPPHPHLIGV